MSLPDAERRVVDDTVGMGLQQVKARFLRRWADHSQAPKVLGSIRRIRKPVIRRLNRDHFLLDRRVVSGAFAPETTHRPFLAQAPPNRSFF
jgi:hypothetical protein